MIEKPAETIIVPDVHGRSFWKEAVKNRRGRKVIFLGDYVDPYQHEGISDMEALRELEAIVELKKKNPSDITLLLGNHDLQYAYSHDKHWPHARFCSFNSFKYRHIFIDSRELFSLVAEIRVKDTKILVSHAGITPQWLCSEGWHLFDIKQPSPEDFGSALLSLDPERINSKWRAGGLGSPLQRYLPMVHSMRGGSESAGSLVWADVSEFEGYPDTPGVFQLFGHTLLKDLYAGNGWADLDCKQAFLLNSEGELSSLA